MSEVLARVLAAAGDTQESAPPTGQGNADVDSGQRDATLPNPTPDTGSRDADIAVDAPLEAA